MSYLAWALELLLESFGAYLFFRRRIVLLSFWLGFRALADLVGMALFFSGQYYAYNWEDHLQRNIQYAILAAVNLYAASRITGERKYAWFWPANFSLIALLAIAHAHAFASGVSVLRLETWIGVILAGIVAGAMGLVNGKAPEPWGRVAIGLVVLGGTDALLAFLQWHGYHSQPYYPVGAITALVILAWAAWKPFKLPEFRGEPKQERKPPQGLTTYDEAFLRELRIQA